MMITSFERNWVEIHPFKTAIVSDLTHDAPHALRKRNECPGETVDPFSISVANDASRIGAGGAAPAGHIFIREDFDENLQSHAWHDGSCCRFAHFRFCKC